MDPRDPADLEYTAEQMEAMGRAALERAVAHVAGLPDQPICGDVEVDDLCRAMREPVPEAGADLETLLDRLYGEWIPRSFTTSAPGYMAYIPGGGLFPAGLADLIADTSNRFTGIWRAAPALVQLEANVLAWFRAWMQFPETAAGLLTPGGSMATFNAILCARERHLGPDLRSGTAYVSEEVHHCVFKAARLAGIMPDRVRRIPVDERFRMRVDALRKAIARDRADGLRPFLVVGSAGTINTGAVDPLDELADLAARERVWFHLDGAYGAFFHVCPELRPLLAGLPRADSLALDPHKGLFLPYGTGALLVRDGAALRAVHAIDASYLPPPATEDLYDPARHGPDLSRGFPGLRVWMCVKLFGAARLRAAIAEKRQLALDAARRIGALPAVRVLDAPALSLFAFHLRLPGAAVADENAATRSLLDRVRARGRVMITGCEAGGRFVARVCVLSFRTRQAQVDTLVEHVAEETDAILRGERVGPGPRPRAAAAEE